MTFSPSEILFSPWENTNDTHLPGMPYKWNVSVAREKSLISETRGKLIF